jgi:hypothetical protein
MSPGYRNSDVAQVPELDNPGQVLVRPEDAVHDIGSALQDGPDLLAVDQLGHGGALVADQPGDLFQRDATVGQQ